MTVNKERIELWAQALESDGHEQCAGMLRRIESRGDGSEVETNCALGVGILVAVANGCKLSDRFEWEAWSWLPDRVREWYGLPTPNPRLDLAEEDLQFSPYHSDWSMYCKKNKSRSMNLQGRSSVITLNDVMLLPFKIIAELLRRTYVDK